MPIKYIWRNNLDQNTNNRYKIDKQLFLAVFLMSLNYLRKHERNLLIDIIGVNTQKKFWKIVQN